MDGTWPSGSRLPSEHELTQKYQVSRPTIRNAKSILTKECFIHSIRGSGCYVNNRDTWKTQIPTVDNLNDIFFFGTKMSFRIHEFGMVANTEEIKTNLKNPKDKFVFQIKGVRWFQNRPLSSVVYYLPYRFGSGSPWSVWMKIPSFLSLKNWPGYRWWRGFNIFPWEWPMPRSPNT